MQERGAVPTLTGHRRRAAVLVLVFVVGLSRALSSPVRAVAMGLVLGGALGNLTDRVFRSNGGAVIDFIDPQWWPIFNVADAAISCGIVLLLISGFGQRESQP